MTRRAVLQFSGLFFGLVTIVALSRSAHADCWEQMTKNTFALNNDFYTTQGGATFIGWSQISSLGALEYCEAGTDYDVAEANHCWMWRHRCDTSIDYIRIGANAHIHVPDYLGRLGPVETRGYFQPHQTGWLLHVYLEGPGGGHDLVDLDYIHIAGVATAILSVKDDDGVWWDSGPLPPNGGDAYYDVSDFGWLIRDAVLTDVAGTGRAVELDGVYFVTYGE